MILNHCNIDLDKKDRWGRTVLDVASPQCNQFLRQTGKLKTLLYVQNI